MDWLRADTRLAATMSAPPVTDRLPKIQVTGQTSVWPAIHTRWLIVLSSYSLAVTAIPLRPFSMRLRGAVKGFHTLRCAPTCVVSAVRWRTRRGYRCWHDRWPEPVAVTRLPPAWVVKRIHDLRCRIAAACCVPGESRPSDRTVRRRMRGSVMGNFECTQLLWKSNVGTLKSMSGSRGDSGSWIRR